MAKHLRQQDAERNSDKGRKDGKRLVFLVDFGLMTDLGLYEFLPQYIGLHHCQSCFLHR